MISSRIASLIQTTSLKARPMGQIKVVGPGHSIWTGSLEACVNYCDASDQCDAINYHSSTHKCRLFAPCTHVYSMYGSLDYYFYSKRPQILDHGFVFDKDRDTCIKLMEIDSNMIQGDRVCTQQNGRLLYLSSPSSQDIAVKLMIRARQKPQYVWTGGGEPWDWKSESSESRISNFFPSNQDYGGLCSVLEITGQWLKVPCDQGNYMSLCEVPAFYTLVKQYPLPPSTVAYPTVSFPSYDALTTTLSYPSPYDNKLPDSNYPPHGSSVPTSPTYLSGYYPPWSNANPPGYVPFYGSPVPPRPTYVYTQYVPYIPGQYPSYPVPPATYAPPLTPLPTYGPPIPSPAVTYGTPVSSPPATYGPPDLPPIYSPPVTAPPATYGPPMTPPPVPYGPPMIPPPATYGPPMTPPPAPYGPPMTPPPATYGPPMTPPPATYGPPMTPPPATYESPITNPPATYRPPITFPPATYGPPITFPPATYSPPTPPVTYSPFATYGPPAAAPPAPYGPPLTSPPAPYGPPLTSPPAPYGPPLTSPPAPYGPPLTSPPAPYGPPLTSPPAPYGPPLTSPPASYVPPVTAPPPTYRPALTPPPIYPTYSISTPQPPYRQPPPFPPSFKPSQPPPPTYRTFPFYKDGKPHYHLVVPETQSYGYPGPPQGPIYPTTPQTTYYHHQAPRPPVFYQPLPRPNCGPSYQRGYDCEATSPPVAISTFPPGINPYFPPLVIYQPGYANYPPVQTPTPHYKGYVPPAAHPTNIPYKPFTDFPERPPFQGRTYVVKDDMAYEIPTLHKYHRWDRDNINSDRFVDNVHDLNGAVEKSKNNTTEQLKDNLAKTVPNHKHINESTFYYSKNNYLSNAGSLPRDALAVTPKDINGANVNNNIQNLGNSTITNTTVINKNSTFRTNVEYTKELNTPSKVTIEIQRDGILSQIVLPNDTKRNNNKTAVITPVHPG
ncbi:hypothetical protein WDU94_000935 [Cyamophila willieti]